MFGALDPPEKRRPISVYPVRPFPPPSNHGETLETRALNERRARIYAQCHSIWKKVRLGASNYFAYVEAKIPDDTTNRLFLRLPEQYVFGPFCFTCKITNPDNFGLSVSVTVMNVDASDALWPNSSEVVDLDTDNPLSLSVFCSAAHYDEAAQVALRSNSVRAYVLHNFDSSFVSAYGSAAVLLSGPELERFRGQPIFYGYHYYIK
jgi:hypothetical protein